MRILIAEDEPSLRDNLQLLLEMEGHSVQLAVDGQDALEQARRSPPDLVLTDVMMPLLDGYGLIAALRAEPATRAVPIVMLTARADSTEVDKGLRLGANGHLVKPYRRAELLDTVQAYAGTQA